MSASSGAGGPSGSSGILSSLMRAITRQSGEPHDREARRIEDTVVLSPFAAVQQSREEDQATEDGQRPVEPAEPSGGLRNPGAGKVQFSARPSKDETEAIARDRATMRGGTLPQVERQQPWPSSFADARQRAAQARTRLQAELMAREAQGSAQSPQPAAREAYAKSDELDHAARASRTFKA